MVLFFIMALVAAYANRNLVLEQRVALNFQRLGVVNEATHEAVALVGNWMNAGNLDEQCRPDVNGDGRFWDRYLIVLSDGRIDVPPDAKPPEAQKALANEKTPYVIACDRVGNGDWSCQCPKNHRPVFVPEDGQVRQSFVVRLRPYNDPIRDYGHSANLGRIGINVASCFAASSTCSRLVYDSNEAVPLAMTVQSFVLNRAVRMPPASALVVRRDVDLSDGMQVVNNNPAAGGVVVQAGGEVTGVRDGVRGPAGSPHTLSVAANQASLAAADSDRFFRLFFGMYLAEYVTQPAMRTLTCNNRCALALQALVQGGARLIRFHGDLELAEDVVIGTPESPVVLIVDGSLRINSPLQLHGLVFSSDDLSWSNVSAKPSVVQGAVLVGGRLVGDKGAAVLFDGAAMERLKLGTGSFLPLPGGAGWGLSWDDKR